MAKRSQQISTSRIIELIQEEILTGIEQGTINSLYSRSLSEVDNYVDTNQFFTGWGLTDRQISNLKVEIDEWIWNGKHHIVSTTYDRHGRVLSQTTTSDMGIISDGPFDEEGYLIREGE